MSKKIKFRDLPLSESIQSGLEALGFTEPTEVQEKAIPLLLENDHVDMHAQAQTGTGKTLAFGLPLLEKVDSSNRAVQALVLAPTRELVTQIYDSLTQAAAKTGIGITPIYGGMPMERQRGALKKGPQIVIGTPGRVIDHLKRKTLSLKALDTLVLDEADIMLDMGFREDIDEVLEFAPSNRQIWLFSATVKSGIKDLVKSHMRNVATVRSETKNVATRQTKQYVCMVPARNRVEALSRFIEQEAEFYGIIFAPTKIKTTEIAEQLIAKGLTANVLHGDLNQPLRNKVIKGFKNRDFSILVATDVAARGIDITGLTHVVNFSIPDDSESYIHRIGRTGRAGKEGVSITFASRNEQYKLKRLERMVNTTLEVIEVPSIESIVQSKLSACTEFIAQAQEREDSAHREAIASIVSEYSDDEIKKALVAALEANLFAHLSGDDIGHEDMSHPQEICIGIGKLDGLTQHQLADYLVSVGKLDEADIMKIRVLNKQSFILIPGSKVNDFMQAIQGKPLSKRRYRVQLVEESTGGRGDRRRDSRGGGHGRRGRREHRGGRRRR